MMLLDEGESSLVANGFASSLTPRVMLLAPVFSRISPRIWTALFGIPLVLVLLWRGGDLFKGFVLLLALGAMREVAVALKKSEAYGGALVVGAVTYIALGFAVWVGVSPFWALGTLVALLLQAVLFYDTRARLSLASVAVSLLATVYLSLFALWPPLREFENGKWLLFSLFCVWGSDTLAYYGGRALGKRKLTSLSPGKTLEGAICGFFGAILIGFGFSIWGDFSLFDALSLGAILGIAAPLGDLVESFWKRELGVKDMGTLFPGHGGILDRCDSLLLAILATTLFLHGRGEFGL